MQERIPYDSCPLCGSTDFRSMHVADCSAHVLYQAPLTPEIHWGKCNVCTHVFTNGYFTDEACKIIFSRTHENQKVGYDLERQRIISSRIVEKVLPYVSEGNWLDVGFGNGALLFTAQEYGFTAIGADLRIDNVDIIKSRGLQAYCLDLTELQLDGACAVISMADVLEHMPFPKQGLQAAHRMLSSGGVLFVSMPNSESVLWDVLTLNDANPYWEELEHYHNFSRSRLYELLKETGFEPVRYSVSERYRACMEVIALKK